MGVTTPCASPIWMVDAFMVIMPRFLLVVDSHPGSAIFTHTFMCVLCAVLMCNVASVGAVDYIGECGSVLYVGMAMEILNLPWLRMYHPDNSQRSYKPQTKHADRKILPSSSQKHS